MMVFTVMPWHIMPTQVTEDVVVIATAEYGCVAESELGVSVVVGQCGAQAGDVISATFNVPAMELNGYHDRTGSEPAAVEP